MHKEKFVPQIQVRSCVRSGQGGGYVNGVWYPDQSGVCGGNVQPPSPTPTPPTPTPPVSGGGYVGGVWYPDKSGACG